MSHVVRKFGNECLRSPLHESLPEIWAFVVCMGQRVMTVCIDETRDAKKGKTIDSVAKQYIPGLKRGFSRLIDWMDTFQSASIPKAKVA